MLDNLIYMIYIKFTKYSYVFFHICQENFFEEIHKSQKIVHDALNLFIIAAIWFKEDNSIQIFANWQSKV